MSETTEDNVIILHEFLVGNKAHAMSSSVWVQVAINLHLSCTICMSVCMYVPYCLKLRPVSYKRQVSISGLGIARYNIINHIAIALHESLATIRIHC